VKRGLIWLSVVLVLVVGGKYGVQHMQESAVTYEARTRVQEMLDGFKEGGDRTNAIDMWSTGVRDSTKLLGTEEASNVMRGMARWLADKGLRNTITSYTIDDVVFEKEREGYQTSIARVYCTIDGRSVDMLVARTVPIAWAN
jgi:hypothetical protein